MSTELQTSITDECCQQSNRKIDKEETGRLLVLDKYKVLTDRQSSFRKGKSCVTNLLSYYDKVAETMQERDG